MDKKVNMIGRSPLEVKKEDKLVGERRRALLLKKAVLQEMKKQQVDMHQAWINRGRR